ncbi:MAG: VWA domain-containing protein [Acidobacteriota bacterium]|nr:VWA domain-containing protein [Acidobacteriota bacterium]
MMFRSTIALLLAALMAAPTFAQDVPRAGASVEVSIVNVDVFVTDRQGNRVRGLKAEDFEIFENGTRKPISNFAEYAGGDAHVSVEPGAAEPAPPRQKRNLVLFFEEMRLPAFSADKLIGGMKDLVHRTISSGDAASVVLWSRSGTRYIEATDDLAKLDSALDSIGVDLKRARIDEGAQTREESVKQQQFEIDAAMFAASAAKPPVSPRGGNTPDPETGGVKQADTPAGVPEIGSAGASSARLGMLVAYQEMQRRVAAINSAINTLTGVEGKKIVLLATRRLGEVAGAEVVFQRGALYVPAELKQQFSTDTLMQTVMNNANASGVTLYPVYPPGATDAVPEAASDVRLVPGAEESTLLNETRMLQQLADRTGGLTAASVTDVVKLLPRISDDVTDYYSLAYRVTDDRKGQTRKIVVKARNPEYRVRSRREYVEKTDEAQMRDRLVSALFRTQRDSPVPIEATLGTPKSNSTAVPLSVHIPINALTMLPEGDGKHAGSFSVYVVTAEDLDRLSEVTHKTQPFQIAEADLARAKAGHFTYDLDLTLSAKTKYVAVGVYDEVGKTFGLTRLERTTR